MSSPTKQQDDNMSQEEMSIDENNTTPTENSSKTKQIKPPTNFHALLLNRNKKPLGAKNAGPQVPSTPSNVSGLLLFEFLNRWLLIWFIFTFRSSDCRSISGSTHPRTTCSVLALRNCTRKIQWPVNPVIWLLNCPKIRKKKTTRPPRLKAKSDPHECSCSYFFSEILCYYPAFYLQTLRTNKPRQTNLLSHIHFHNATIFIKQINSYIILIGQMFI